MRYFCLSKQIQYCLLKNMMFALKHVMYFKVFNQFYASQNLTAYNRDHILINLDLENLRFYDNFLYQLLVNNPIDVLSLLEITLLKIVFYNFNFLIREIKV